MYKKRFKQWNARKYNEESEMRAIVRKRAERARVGKASTFKVRSQVVDIQKVFRYWERKNRSVDDIVTRRPMSRTPEAVECLTPLLSPLRTPEELATPERLLLKLQDYIRGSVDAGKWRDFREERSLDRFYDQCHLAFQLLDNNHYLEAGQSLNNAFANINTIIRSEHPSTLRILLATTNLAFEREKPEIALAILHHVSAMAEKVLATSHPFKVISMGLASLGQTKEALYRDVWSISLQKMADCFQEVLGPTHGETLTYRLDFIQRFEVGHDLKREERALGKLLRDCELSMVEQEFRILHVRLRLAVNFYEQGHFVQAKDACQRLLSCLPPSDDSHFKGRCLECLAWSQYNLGDTQGAVATMRESIYFDLSGESSEHGWACIMMLNLEVWLSELGESDSAAQVQARRMRVQDFMRVEWL